MTDDSNRLAAGDSEPVAKWKEEEGLPLSKNQHPRQDDAAAQSHDAARGDFSKIGFGCELPKRSEKNQNQPILKMFEREDWTLFRTIEGLRPESRGRR